MSIKSKLFYSALELLLKWVMKKKGGHSGSHFGGYGQQRHDEHAPFGSKKQYGKKPYYKKKGWFD
jgi:hypothetical protein